MMTRSEVRGRNENMPRVLKLIAEKGKECRDYQKMIETVRNKEKAYKVESDNPLRELSNVHNELNVVESEAGDLLYAGEKLLPPKSARQELLMLAHMTHLEKDIIWNNVKKYSIGHH